MLLKPIIFGSERIAVPALECVPDLVMCNLSVASRPIEIAILQTMGSKYRLQSVPLY